MVHCWTDEGEHIEATYGYASAEYAQHVFDDPPVRVCMLPENHDGPHVWADADDIMVEFKGEAEAGDSE